MSVNYIAAYLRHKESSIIQNKKAIKKTNAKKPKIQLKLSDIYNIETPIVSSKVQKDIDKLSLEASSYLKKSVQKTKEMEDIISD